jgi:hypothetical protein
MAAVTIINTIKDLARRLTIKRIIQSAFLALRCEKRSLF